MLTSTSEEINDDPSFDPKKWMARIPGGVSVARISVPGSHESCAQYSGTAFVCQYKSLPEQMEAGCRFFDIRCRAQGDRFAIHHGELYQHLAFGDVLEYCKGFLSENPTETLFMRVKQEYSSVSNEEFKRIFYGYDTSHFYLESRVPTLSEVRGKIILLANVAGLGGIDYGGSDLFIQDDYEPKSWQAKLDEIWSQVYKSVTRESGDNRISVNYTSYWSINNRMNAWCVQPPLDANLRKNYGAHHQGPLGIIALDFYNVNLSVEGSPTTFDNSQLISVIINWNAGLRKVEIFDPVSDKGSFQMNFVTDDHKFQVESLWMVEPGTTGSHAYVSEQRGENMGNWTYQWYADDVHPNQEVYNPRTASTSNGIVLRIRGANGYHKDDYIGRNSNATGRSNLVCTSDTSVVKPDEAYFLLLKTGWPGWRLYRCAKQDDGSFWFAGEILFRDEPHGQDYLGYPYDLPMGDGASAGFVQLYKPVDY
ncbi:phosphatidylinositol-specific phospholipase C [Streptomyces sp. NBUL23]|uniref:phosphatidylinositol-specific phospholipase C n=1 Tax=Streptomyces sp. NBUL23 TaxID=3381354 RepID=UPI00387235AF